jgi:hypothetical protein
VIFLGCGVCLKKGLVADVVVRGCVLPSSFDRLVGGRGGCSDNSCPGSVCSLKVGGSGCAGGICQEDVHSPTEGCCCRSEGECLEGVLSLPGGDFKDRDPIKDSQDAADSLLLGEPRHMLS